MLRIATGRALSSITLQQANSNEVGYREHFTNEVLNPNLGNYDQWESRTVAKINVHSLTMIGKVSIESHKNRELINY